MSKKYAYLIIAHKDDLTFYTLLRMLDVPENDIFIHMDLKNNSYDKEYTENHVKNAGVYHTARTSVSWGGYSQINSEMLLLKAATGKGTYEYYHLLSGEDLPIKRQRDIRAFFEKNKGKEFIGIQNNYNCRYRVAYRYFLQEKCNRNQKNIYYISNNILVAMQKLLHIERNRKISFQKGLNWFSITDSFARYVVDKENWIKTVFKNTICCDEVFLQTLLYNSGFINNRNVSELNDNADAMRLIDWNRGEPYVFKEEDIDEIKVSKMMFARKFQCEKDSRIIKLIEKEFGEPQ